MLVNITSLVRKSEAPPGFHMLSKPTGAARFVNSLDGEPGHNYPCAGFKSFFDHVIPAMKTMAQLVRNNGAPAEIMKAYSAKDFKGGRNDKCHCGRGKKFKHCHGLL